MCTEYFTGILIDIETPTLEEAPSVFAEEYEKLKTESEYYLSKILDPEGSVLEHYKIPVQEINGKRCVLKFCVIDFPILPSALNSKYANKRIKKNPCPVCGKVHAEYPTLVMEKCKGFLKISHNG